VTGAQTLLLDRIAPDLDLTGLAVESVHAIVANQRIRCDQYLAAVGGVSERLLITCHSSGKNDFAEDFLVGAERLPLENCPILED